MVGHLLLSIPSRFSSICASYFHPWLGGRVWILLHTSLNFYSENISFLTKIYILSIFSSRWIQPKRKGCPTSPSHPKVILASSSPPEPKSYFCCCYQQLHTLLPCLPCPFHTGSREEGRVMWEYVCAGWESNEEMHLDFYSVYILKAIACFSYSPPVLTAWVQLAFMASRQRWTVSQLSTTRFKHSLHVCYR